MTGERRCPPDGSMPEGVPRRSALTIRNRLPAYGLGHSPMATAANENPPDGDHRAGSSGGHGALPGDSRAEVLPPDFAARNGMLAFSNEKPEANPEPDRQSRRRSSYSDNQFELLHPLPQSPGRATRSQH
jgi:hypothetical protein